MLWMLITCLVIILIPRHVLTSTSPTDPVVVEVITGHGEDSCGVYPGCGEEGSWAVLEDCTRL